jgi:hypothetical protein
MTRIAVRFTLAGLAGAAGFALSARPAAAQIPEVQTDGSLSDPAKPPPAPPPTPIIINTPAPAGQGQPGQPSGEATSGEAQAPAAGATGGGARGYYHVDESGFASEEDQAETTLAPGEVPPVHVVRAGDTLWDLCFTYFNNPWEWPRVWSYNPEITNPHWIYPGDQVRLRTGGQEPPKEGTAAAPRVATRPARPPAAGFFELRQIAFLAPEELVSGIAVDGSPEEKLMLAAGDEAYLSYPDEKPPHVGQRYAVYLEREHVRHPATGADLGAYVRIVGEVEIISAAPGKRARAVVLDSVAPVERGMRVGPIQRQFRHVEPAAAEVDLEGFIVAAIQSEDLIGARQVVILDRGGQDRVKVGNRLFVIRRGDAYARVMGPYSNIGKNDSRFPARSIGEILVVQTGRHSSVAVVVNSDRELGVGDRVLMKRGRAGSRAR